VGNPQKITFVSTADTVIAQMNGGTGLQRQRHAAIKICV